MARIQFVANNKLVDALKAIMVVDDITMAEAIRRSIVNWFFLRAQIHQGKRVMIHDPETDEYTSATLK